MDIKKIAGVMKLVRHNRLKICRLFRHGSSSLPARTKILFLTISLLIPTSTFSHDIYSTWKDENGFSCCNEKDCQPTIERITQNHYEAIVGSKWIEIPNNKILKQSSPDGQPHVCINKAEIVLCYQPGMGT